jgi:hypothetical protein
MLEGLLKLAEARALSEEEVVALDLYTRANSRRLWHFMLPSTESVLQRLAVITSLTGQGQMCLIVRPAMRTWHNMFDREGIKGRLWLQYQSKMNTLKY